VSDIIPPDPMVVTYRLIVSIDDLGQVRTISYPEGSVPKESLQKFRRLVRIDAPFTEAEPPKARRLSWKPALKTTQSRAVFASVVGIVLFVLFAAVVGASSEEGAAVGAAIALLSLIGFAVLLGVIALTVRWVEAPSRKEQGR
jgi:hypothetical protein